MIQRVIRSGYGNDVMNHTRSLVNGRSLKFTIQTGSASIIRHTYSRYNYSTTPNKPKQTLNERLQNNNFVFKTLKYVQDVDEQQKQLEQAATDSKITQLIERISDNKELLYLLTLYHRECFKLGIAHESIIPVKSRQNNLRFKFWYWFKLKPINDSFWEICHLLNISNHKHGVNFNKIDDIGLLDPNHFPVEFMDQLKTGRFNDVDFRNVEIMLFNKLKFVEPVNE
ncbi:hypothetical protein DFJ63DRAFT_310601 [Scheffersomyces coipomensis]|uniref:uncharacterized protein n=1 Tax=Scheffersomyces coipomensis TaxID=1788519 RepID=UPI00315D24A2